MNDSEHRDLGRRPVLVTTEHRGVFFGWSEKTEGPTIKLHDARLAIYWSKSTKGFLGLAANGPDNECRISPPADIEVRNVTSVSEVTEKALANWNLAPWAE